MTEDAAKHVVRESMSALVDDQASELELHRILRESEGDSEIRATWARYQLVSAALRGEMPAGEYVDLSSRIRDAIAAEPPLLLNEERVDDGMAAEAAKSASATATVGVAASGAGGNWWRSAGRFAIAASVAGVVVVSALVVNKNDSSGVGTTVADSNSVQDDHTPAVSSPIQARAVSTLDEGGTRPSQGQSVNFIPRTPEQRIPNEVIQKRLNQLMLEHAEHAAQNSGRGMLPFARIPRVDEE